MVIAIDIRLIGKKRTGDETVFFHLTRALLKQDTENQYLLLTDISEDADRAVILGRLEAVGKKNVEIVTPCPFLRFIGKNRFVWNIFALPWFLFRHHIDIYHTQYILPLFFPARTKMVTHIHDVSFRAHPEFIGWADRFFLALLIPSSLRRASAIIAPSEFTRSEIIRYYPVPETKVEVVKNALGDDFLSLMTENSESVSSVKEKYGLPDQYLLFVGTFQPRKNIPFLLQAFALFRKRLPEMKLVLVGSLTAHNVDPRIESTLHDLGLEEAVIFPGFVSQKDLPNVIRGATLFVFPSRYEGFGIPILEAMSQNVPAVVSDIPSLREVAGEAVLYFKASHVSEVASAAENMYTLCTDQSKRAEMIRLGQERLKLFSWEESARSVSVIYRALHNS